MGRGHQYPQAVQLQVRVPQAGLGSGIYTDEAPQKTSKGLSWAGISLETDTRWDEELAPVTKPPRAAPADIELRDITAAVESLYTDELKPYGRILRKRLAEHAETRGRPDLDINIERLRVRCEESAKFCVEVEDSGEWSAIIVGRAPTFADVYSSHDGYPAALWERAAAYFESLPDNDSKFPGGRYGCAQALAARALSFLRGLSLGQVSHIVQLAISQKKILGYSKGSIMPYGRSQSMIKDRCAKQRTACGTGVAGPAVSRVAILEASNGQASPELTLATWQAARELLREILRDACNSGKSQVPISNVKRIFRSRFQVELSETALGHSKLSELLQDAHFRDICTVQLKGKGYVVVPVLDAVPTELPAALSSNILETSSEEPVFPHPLSRDVYIGSIVRNTFIHFGSPSPAGRRRAQSLPKDFCSSKHTLETTCCALTTKHRPTHGSNSDIETSVGGVSCSTSESSDDVHSEIYLLGVESMEVGRQQDSTPSSHNCRNQLLARPTPAHACGAAWRRSPSVRRHEQAEHDYWETSSQQEFDGHERVAISHLGFRTPSPSPPPGNHCMNYQVIPFYTSFMPLTCAFVAPGPPFLCLADCL